MSSTGSRDSSSRGSPYSSNNDLMDDDLYNDRPMKKSRGKRGADQDEIEQTIHKAQQDAEEFTTDYNKYRTDTQNHARRIKDLILLAQENRRRLDALLGKTSRSRIYEDDLGVSLERKRPSIDSDIYDRRSSRGSRGSRGSFVDEDRRGSRGGDDGRGSRGSDDSRRGSNYVARVSKTSEHIIEHTNGHGMVEVGVVTLSNNMVENNVKGNPNKNVSQKMMESKANITMSPKVSKKKPFTFGTVSLQVKLED